jgi:hypothetical protein
MTRRKMTNSVVRDLLVLLALCLIFGGTASLWGIAVGCLVLGALLLSLLLLDRKEPEA